MEYLAVFERIYAYGEERGGECISPSERECSGTHARRNVDDDDDECHLVEYLANIPRGEFSRTCDQDAGTGARDAGHASTKADLCVSLSVTSLIEDRFVSSYACQFILTCILYSFFFCFLFLFFLERK